MFLQLITYTIELEEMVVTSCGKFQQVLNDFITIGIDDEDIDFFVGHAKNCKDCYEELEINYMVNVGLDRIEKDSGASFDLKGQLEKKLRQLEDKSDRLYKFNVYKKMVCITADICTVVTVILFVVTML